ncbi:MAG: CHAD domain-containing protein [Burkholderiaceae bacterium]
MNETELRFHVPASQRVAVEAAVAGRGVHPRLRLQAAYHDTIERRLAVAGLALRMRREGRRWVQTLKGGTADGMTRMEHNVPLGAAAIAPVCDPARHASTPVGQALLACLEGAGALVVLYRTDILRRTRALRTAHGRVELAFDNGRIHAANRQIDVRELEIELLAGSPQAVLDTALRWLPRFGLWLDTRSKAERGDLLARGEVVAPPRLASPVRLAPAMSAAMAWRTVLRSCAEQITANASQIAAGASGPEHVHQLRIGLRRLRSAVSLFGDGDDGDRARLGSAAAALFRSLGSARDAAVLEGDLAVELRAVMRGAGVAVEAASLPSAPDAPMPAQIVRQPDCQILLLDLIAAASQADVDASSPDACPLRQHAARRLNQWHREMVADLDRFAELDDASRHRLRKRAKRLRYAAEFCAALFERKAVRRYLRALRALQDRLGALSDVVMAIESITARPERDAQAMFALGWFTARREPLIGAVAPESESFAKVERFWKRR